MQVQVEVSDGLFSDEIRILENLAKHIQKEIKDLLGVSCKVKLVEPKTIQRSEGKAQRVIDNRNI
jgi:phenylacetate-CoA ligase